MSVRVLVVDDQHLFREGLVALLSAYDAIAVVGEACNGDEGLRVAIETRPDVVLMDLRMPVVDGVTAIRRLREALPDVRVIALTTFDDDDSAFDALRAGAVGYLLKDTGSAKLVAAIVAASRGESVVEPAVLTKVLTEFARLSEPLPTPPDSLSERERQVLDWLGRGASNKEIAIALRISEGTVKNHLTNVFAKLGVTDRTQAALAARRLVR